LAISLLALGGALVSSVSLSHHYSTAKSSFCDFGESFNCDIVNRSVYSVIFGIPVALIGTIGYIVLLALAILYPTKEETPAILLIAALAGLGFALYLTYIEAFVLAVWCILCLTSLALILAIAVLSAVLVVYRVRWGCLNERAGSSTSPHSGSE
jgi:vitamin-K-epoxide reductase (warfarin-sensitive)